MHGDETKITTDSQSVSRKAKKKQAIKHRQALYKASQQVKNKKTKITKEERKQKYTEKAREKRTRGFIKMNNVNTVCFRCRKKGHTVNECTSMVDGDSDLSIGSKKEGTNEISSNRMGVETRMCYKCGSMDHPLKKCPKLDFKEKNYNGKDSLDFGKMKLPFVTCFVCNQMGHISSQCGQNKKGIYVNGGCCKECGNNDHVYSNCPKRKKPGEKEITQNFEPIENLLESAGGDNSATPNLTLTDAHSSVKRKNSTRKVVKF